MSPSTTPPSSRSSTRSAAHPAESGEVELPAAHAIALAWAAFLLALPLLAALPAGEGRALRLSLALLASAFALPALRRDVLRQGSRAVRGIAWDADGFEVQCASGERDRVRLCHGSLCTRDHAWLLLEGRRRHRVFLEAGRLPPREAASLWRALRRNGRLRSDLL